MSKDGSTLEAPPAYAGISPAVSAPPLSNEDVPKLDDMNVKSEGNQKEEIIVITSTTHLKHKSTNVICPYCLTNVKTKIKHKSNSKTHLYGFLLCLIGGIICCTIPYCLPQCQTTNHYCPNCKTFLGCYPAAP
ncbi:lipopolysaccharide-induced tumor necrosis factor-alpha factor homolog [Anthonomus grandis grandis]|uniref:lipopolysaccharide-induced tumor necrosis factor-alpha factor homolog n=1 Tax=Anthonomus grandis grandis TaxID=2921223 RepID=UPI002166470B|nr:lipopolysaccharide-induced tumor necrosis factor-alpha factor homolog [Anthonomus grandis grandis]